MWRGRRPRNTLSLCEEQVNCKQLGLSKWVAGSAPWRGGRRASGTPAGGQQGVRSLSWGVAAAARPGDGLGTAQLVLGLGVRPERAHRDAGRGAPAAWPPAPAPSGGPELLHMR